MKTPCGHLRKLTDGQIREVLKWHQEAIEFRRRHGALDDLAILLGVTLHAVRGCFENRIPCTAKEDGIQASHSRGRRGRPRHLNPEQIAFAIAWRNVGRRFYARHGSVACLARKLGVGASTIHDCIRRQGQYTQHAHTNKYEARITRRSEMPDDARRSALLRAWLRPKQKP